MSSDLPPAADPPAGLDPSRLDIESRQVPLEELLARMRGGELDVGLPSDRDAWSDSIKSRLIESLLIRIPLPALYVDAADEDRWVVIDGRRRMSALGDFMLDKAYVLGGLEYLTELEGQGYDDLARALKRRLGETQVTVELVKPGTPTAIRCNIFHRINPRLTHQEVRDAVIRGAGSELLGTLADGPAYRAATGVEAAKAIDRESILRFLALFPLAHPPPLDRPFQEVLTATLEALGEESLDGMLRRHLLTQRFEAAMAVAADLFEGRAFRTEEGEEAVSPALLETVSVALARLDNAECERLRARRDEVIKAFTELLHDQDFVAAVAPGIDDPASVRHRHAAVRDLLGQFVSA